jgi:class 3 adenylate cyclase
VAQSSTLTFLFTDLINSTQHLQELGDETGQSVFSAHHKRLTDSVNAAGGEELEWLGDGILAVFSSTADAVRCAVNIQQTARHAVFGTLHEIRIGIHVGEALRREGGYFGTPLVVARRLCDRDSPGQILCGQLVAAVLSGRQTFKFEKLGCCELKGIATPVEVCEVIYTRNDPAAILSHAPFVGRTAQLNALSARLSELEAGRGAVVMLRGEPGIGKSRLLEEFADHARQRGAMVLRGACYDGEWQPAYGPFAEAILEYSGRTPAEFTATIGNNGAIIARIAPGLERSLGQVADLA